MPKYIDELTRAMKMLSDREGVTILGQAVEYPGTGMTQTFAQCRAHTLKEFPVAEEMQMGAALGIALAGGLPICVFPRWNFVLRATDQLVNHVDKLHEARYGNGYWPRIIVRTAVCSPEPLNPGPQHLGDLSVAFRHLLRHVDVVRLHNRRQIVSEYDRVASDPRAPATVFVEYAHLYDSED